jgi:hypothetical protein
MAAKRKSQTTSKPAVEVDRNKIANGLIESIELPDPPTGGGNGKPVAPKAGPVPRGGRIGVGRGQGAVQPRWYAFRRR